MGQEVCRAVASARGLDLTAAVDPKAAGKGLDEVVGPDLPPVVVSENLSAIAESGTEVAVDFTDAAAARQNVPACLEMGIHAVVGTTGLDPQDLVSIEDAQRRGGANVVLATNFAIGAVLLLRFCELAAPLMEGVEVIELHHDQKRDAPSGTALQTASRIAEARRRAGQGSLPADSTTETVLAGTRGGEGPGGVHVHSVRLPGLVAHEEVIFGAPGQSLSLRHDSYDRRSFMAGVLLAIRSVPQRRGVTVGLDALLGI